MLDDPGDVTGGVLQEVHEIGPETGLHDAEHQQVRELRREDAVQRVRTVVPALAEPHTVAARRVEAESAVLIGGDLEAGGENDQIKFIFLAVDDRPVGVIRSMPWPSVSTRCTCGRLKVGRYSSWKVMRLQCLPYHGLSFSAVAGSSMISSTAGSPP